MVNQKAKDMTVGLLVVAGVLSLSIAPLAWGFDWPVKPFVGTAAFCFIIVAAVFVTSIKKAGGS